MEISVLFFGVLADVTGSASKIYTGVSSFEDLVHRINDEFPGIEHYNFRNAVNNEITEGNVILNDNDEVAYLPPFAGG